MGARRRRNRTRWASRLRRARRDVHHGIALPPANACTARGAVRSDGGARPIAICAARAAAAIKLRLVSPKVRRAARAQRSRGRPPGRGLVRDRPGADPLPDGCHRLPGDRPQRERQGDRGVAVVASGRNPARHNGQDRVAMHAPVAPARDHDPAGRTASVRWSAQLAVPLAMAVKPDPAARWAERQRRSRRRPRPRSLRRRWCGKPPLDVEPVMNIRGELRVGFTGTGREHDVDGVGAPSTSPIRRAPCSAPKVGACFYLSQPVRCESRPMRGPGRLSINQTASKPRLHPQQACLITHRALRTSLPPLAAAHMYWATWTTSGMPGSPRGCRSG